MAGIYAAFLSSTQGPLSYGLFQMFSIMIDDRVDVEIQFTSVPPVTVDFAPRVILTICLALSLFLMALGSSLTDPDMYSAKYLGGIGEILGSYLWTVYTKHSGARPVSAEQMLICLWYKPFWQLAPRTISDWKSKAKTILCKIGIDFTSSDAISHLVKLQNRSIHNFGLVFVISVML